MYSSVWIFLLDILIITWLIFVKSSTVQQRRRRILWLRKSFQVHITWHGQQQYSAINPTLNVTQACQCPRVYAVCSYRMPVEIHTIAIYSIYYNKLKLLAEPCLHVFHVCVVLNSAFIYKLNLMLLACHKKSNLICVELTNFWIFTKPISIFFFKVQNWDSQQRAETAAWK